MHARSIAVIVALLMIAAGGFVVVRELTKPAPLTPVPTILVNPDPEPDTSARREARERRQARERREARARRRRENRRRDERSGREPAPAPQEATPAPRLDPLEPGDDGTDDGGGD